MVSLIYWNKLILSHVNYRTLEWMMQFRSDYENE